MTRPLPSRLTTRVVGVTFVSEYPDNLEALDRAWSTAAERGPETPTIHLVRDPNNQHDPNAVRVEWNGGALGHVPAHLAERLAPEMDDGIAWAAHLTQVKVFEGCAAGVDIELNRVKENANV